MSDDVSPFRTARLIEAAIDNTSKASKPDKTAMTPQPSRELKELYAQLAEATVASREAQRIANEKRSASAERRFWDLDLQLEGIISRINQILE